MEHFFTADILLPKRGTDLTRFSVVACDQYTSEPKYWERVRNKTEREVSAYHLIFPEAELKTADFTKKIEQINRTMEEYLDGGVFASYPDSMFYVERTLRNGAVRRGLIGRVDLEEYDYQKGSQSLIRATEGTVLERIPPRVKIREHAPLELPHVMLLVDDPAKSVIEPLQPQAEQWEQVYDFSLMEDSGHLKGWRLPEQAVKQVAVALAALADSKAFSGRYQVEDCPPLLFAVGDGNHSLATAKACYEALKETLGGEAARCHPARYALVELVNLHDTSLEFEAIHRVVFGIDPDHLLQEMKKALSVTEEAIPDGQSLVMVCGERKECLNVPDPDSNLAVGTLQNFLDQYTKTFGGETDYIHGEAVVESLCRERQDVVGFLLPCMEKSELFRTVILDGALPRKTFSMGEACDKRFYLEARKIR